MPSLRKNVPFDPLELTPIGGVGNFSFFWAVHPSLPVKSLRELADYGRANPGKLNAGSSSATATIAPTLFAAAEGFPLQVVPYKSETTALNDLITGRIQVMLITGTLAQHVRDGRARGLAALLDRRSKTLPDLPTMREAGMQPFPAVTWMGLFGPAKMPREVVERLSRELAATLQKPEVREQIERQAMDLNPLSSDAMGALAKEQTEVWRRLTREARFVPRVSKRVIAAKYVLGMREGAQILLQDHYVYVDGPNIEAVTQDAPSSGQEVIATRRPGHARLRQPARALHPRRPFSRHPGRPRDGPAVGPETRLHRSSCRSPASPPRSSPPRSCTR